MPAATWEIDAIIQVLDPKAGGPDAVA